MLRARWVVFLPSVQGRMDVKIESSEAIRRLSNAHNRLREERHKRPMSAKLEGEAQGMENAIRIIAKLVEEETKQSGGSAA